MQLDHLPKALFVTARVSAKLQQIIVKQNTGFLAGLHPNTGLSDIYFPP
jgi:hypothetical protein